jgi:hypothetical protein
MKKKVNEPEQQVELYANLPYTITITKEDDGYGIYYTSRVTELPGLIITGDSPEEALTITTKKVIFNSFL